MAIARRNSVLSFVVIAVFFGILISDHIRQSASHKKDYFVSKPSGTVWFMSVKLSMKEKYDPQNNHNEEVGMTPQMDVLEGGVREMAHRLGIGERQAYREAERGNLPAVKLGGRYVVPLDAWSKFLRGEWRPAERHIEDGTPQNAN